MRSEWIPVSAAALVTGVMALVLAQMLNPGGSDASPAGQMLVAVEYPGRWLAMAVLFFGGASALILGMPATMTLFRSARRGRTIGMVGVGVFTVGCVGVGALAGLMLMFRALALETLSGSAVATEIALVTSSLEETALVVSLGVWVYGFLLGVLLIAIGLLRARATARWVPMLLVAFLVVQVVTGLLEGTPARVGSALGLILLAAGFTGVAIAAASPHNDGSLKHSLV